MTQVTLILLLVSSLARAVTCGEVLREMAVAMAAYQQARVGFEQGEYVTVRKPPDSDKWFMRLAQSPGITIDLTTNFDRAIAIYGGHIGNDLHMIMVPWIPSVSQRGQQGEIVIVPGSQLQRLNVGRESVLFDVTQVLRAQRLSFSSGERVRFRDEDGLMRQGEYVQTSEAGAAIHLAGGSTLPIPLQSIFRAGNGYPSFTPRFSSPPSSDANPILQHSFVPPAGGARAFLDGAARLTSLDHFREMSLQDQFNALIDYHRIFMRAELDAQADMSQFVEVSGFRTIRDFLRVGVASCRQNVSIVGTMLSESGYRVRPVQTLATGNALPGSPEWRQVAGHMWFEVDARNREAQEETWILDLSLVLKSESDSNVRHGAAMPLERVRSIAQRDPNSPMARIYLSPQRIYLEVTPIEPRD